MHEITKCHPAKSAVLRISPRGVSERKKFPGVKINSAVVLQKVIKDAFSDFSKCERWRFSGRLSLIGAAHSGHSESVGIPLTIYPHFSHRSALSSGTAGATRAMELWYTCHSPKSDAEEDGAN